MNHSSLRSFTVVELLISVSIGILLSLLFLKTIDSTGQVIQRNRQSMSCAEEADFIFQRLKTDFQQMPKRLDIGYEMTNAGFGTDFIRIISEVKGYGGERKVSLVGYRLVRDQNGLITLQRGSRGYGWEDSGFMGIDRSGAPIRLGTLPPSLGLEDKGYDLLSSSIFKVSLAFQIKNNGQYSNSPPTLRLGTNAAYSSINITNIASIIVGVVAMDAKSTRLLTPEINERILEKFTEVPNGILPISHWGSNFNADFPEFKKDLPPEIARSVHIFQRIFPME